MKGRVVRRLLWSALNRVIPPYEQMRRYIGWYVSLSPEVARQESQKLLHRYLHYCRTYSSYWRERWPREARRFTPDEVDDILAMLPRLDKTAIHEHRDALRIRSEDRRPNDGFPPIGNQSEVKTGGTTGMPVVVYRDSIHAHQIRATIDFFYRMCGLPPGEPFFYIWGSNNELGEIATNWRKRLSSSLRGLYPMPAFGLTPEKMRWLVREMKNHDHIKSAVCFTSTLETLLDYTSRNGTHLRKLARVFTGGGLLHPRLRQAIEQDLADEVFDTYGSRDFGLMACETSAHDALSIASWMHHIEILDHSGRRVKSGAEGEIHVTAIRNYSFALIRASTGDVARWYSDPGLNSIPTPRLAQLHGRTAEHLKGPNGVVIDPSTIIHMIGVLIAPPWLRKFQMVQYSPVRFELRVESWDQDIAQKNVEDLRRRVQDGLRKLVEGIVDVSIVVLSTIPPSPSGKHLYCIQCPESREYALRIGGSDA